MLFHHILRRTAARLPRFPRVAADRHGLPPRTLLRRFASATPASPATTAAASEKAKAFPSKVLIYFAGKRTLYLGALKLYGVLLFAYNTLIVAPSLLRAPEPVLSPEQEQEQSWIKRQGSRAVAELRRLVGPGLENYALSFLVVAGAAVPLAFVGWTSPPFVTHMRLALPPWARYSPQHLAKFLKAPLPRDTEVELVTMRWYGRPKVTSVKLGELEMKRERWGCVNTVADKGRKGKFYVDWRGSPAKVVVADGLGAVGRAVVELQNTGKMGEGMQEVVKEVKPVATETVRGVARKVDGRGERIM